MTPSFTSMDELIKDIVLSEEEIVEAIRQAKIKKWFHEKHGPYWEEREKIKPKR